MSHAAWLARPATAVARCCSCVRLVGPCRLSRSRPARLVSAHRLHRGVCTATPPPPTGDVTPLARQLSARVRATGAMTVAEYMAEVTTSPLQGYYTARPDIGETGDFVTAPEVTSMYGEMLGVWLVSAWQTLGSPQPLQLVELGPGRGTLVSDILGVINQLVGSVPLSIHLVEVSRELANVQAQTLGARLTSPTDSQSAEAAALASQSEAVGPVESSNDIQSAEAAALASQSEAVGPVTSLNGIQSVEAAALASQSEAVGPVTSLNGIQSVEAAAPGESETEWDTCDMLHGTTRCGRDVRWHSRLQDVPEAFSLVVANEFFDAMPVHQFRRTKAGWREVLVDLSPDDPYQFRFVLARGATPACIFIDEEQAAGRDELEVSPRAAATAALLAARIAADGGAALVCDYGHLGDRGDTLRAFRKHGAADPLRAPGRADVTCDVDFAALARASGPDVLRYGPVSQQQFLEEMGLAARLERLVAASTAQRAAQLRAAYHMLVGRMGQPFKMWAMLPATAAPILRRRPPAGFATTQPQAAGATDTGAR